MIARKDRSTFPEKQLDAFTMASVRKRLVIHPGGHFDTYVDLFGQTSAAASEWFAAHLQMPESE